MYLDFVLQQLRFISFLSKICSVFIIQLRFRSCFPVWRSTQKLTEYAERNSEVYNNLQTTFTHFSWFSLCLPGIDTRRSSKCEPNLAWKLQNPLRQPDSEEDCMFFFCKNFLHSNMKAVKGWTFNYNMLRAYPTLRFASELLLWKWLLNKSSF